MKKAIVYTLAVLLLAAIFLTWKVFGPATRFDAKNYYLLIHTGASYDDVKANLEKDQVIGSLFFFDIIAKRLDYPSRVKAGRYNIPRHMSIFNLLRMLKNGRQEPVNLIITKIRTREELASMVGRRFECDSASFMQFLQNGDSLKSWGLDTNTVMTTILPNTYTYFWNTTPSRIFSKFRKAHDEFWNEARLAGASAHGLNPQTAYILSSIVEEETTKKDDKGKIASVYLNRMAKGMRLSADPTVKYALRQFSLKRIYEKHLTVESPYNTYRVMGLPPGPICTPSEETLDAVVNSPKTNYLFFVAKPGLDGYSNFSETYAEHLKYAKEYQQWLDKYLGTKQSANDDVAP